MARERQVYVCSSCGAQTPKWQGRCFECGEFNTFILEQNSTQIGKTSSVAAKPIAYASVRDDRLVRLKTGYEQFDDLIGGGFVAGQVMLIGGEPGIGKSTLMTQLAKYVPIVYVCGEESPEQVRLRIVRLGGEPKDIIFIDETNIEAIVNFLDGNPDANSRILIVDSVQSLSAPHIKSIAGSISQVQYCAGLLCDAVKKNRLACIMVGQINKDGYLAGPKSIEHLVDTVLLFEGDRRADIRLLRVIKNRFGPSGEVELFVMNEKGLESADEYLANLIASSSMVPGRVIGVTLEGLRPLIVEVQALHTPMQYAVPRRIVNGVSVSRVQMLLAVLERRVGIKTSQYDIYVNLAGGIKVTDPGIDLAVCLAVAASVRNKTLPQDLIALGEVGLLGDIKPVRGQERAEAYAQKHGYRQVITQSIFPTLERCVRDLFVGAEK